MRKALNNTLSHRFSNDREYDRHRAGRLFQRLCGRGAGAYDHIWCKSENVPSRALRRFDVKDTPVLIDHGRPTQPLQTLLERPGAIGPIRVILTGKIHKANAHWLACCARSERPRDCRAADKSDEIASPHAPAPGWESHTLYAKGYIVRHSKRSARNDEMGQKRT
jgi:hypothetical protein